MIRQTKTENGLVRGIEAADPRITAFRGVPFARMCLWMRIVCI